VLPAFEHARQSHSWIGKGWLDRLLTILFAGGITDVGRGGPRGLAHGVAEVLEGRTAKRVMASPAICPTGNELNRGRPWMGKSVPKINLAAMLIKQLEGENSWLGPPEN
jgi:hypothetical protein